MKTILSKAQPYLALLSALLLIYGCTPSIGLLSQTDPDDESGIGGTGMLAQTSSLESTAIIGAITGFGSIFINGIEIDIPRQAEVFENGKAVPHPQFAIGDVLEVLTTPGSKIHEARRIHIRHEVSGPVSLVHKEERSFEIMQQLIFMGSLKGPMPKVGQRLQVSGFRDNNQKIHASRIITTQNTTVSLSGQVTEIRGNTLMIGKMLVVAGQLPKVAIGSAISTVGDLRNGKLFAQTVKQRPTLAFADQAKRWLIQGFLSKGPANQLSIAGARAAADNVKLHKDLGRQAAKLIQVEIAKSPIFANTLTITSVLDARILATGSQTPQTAKPPQPFLLRGPSTPHSQPMHPNRVTPNIIRR